MSLIVPFGHKLARIAQYNLKILDDVTLDTYATGTKKGPIPHNKVKLG